MKPNIIEIEQRGRLSAQARKKLFSVFQKEGRLLGEYNQLSVFCESDNKFLGEVENTKVSIAITFQRNLRTNRLKCYLKAKSGRMEAGARTETTISFDYSKLGDILSFLRIFEVNTGCPRFYHRHDYKVHKYTFSIKEKGLAPDHFEIETVVNDVAKVNSAKTKMSSVLNKLGLKPYSESEYKEIMLSTFRRFPPVDFKEIDFTI